MAKKSTLVFLTLFWLFIIHIGDTFSSSLWQPLQPGVEYQQLSPSKLSPFATIHVFKINLDHTSLQFCPNTNNKTTVKNSAKTNKALITLNSGFFSPNFKPLGLRVDKGRLIEPLKHISWWGVFYIKHNKARIVSLKRYHHQHNVSFAVQAGPRLIINDRIPKLKRGLAERTALGITHNNEIILLASEHTSLSTTYLAHLMRDKLNCQYALNLDGGGSTQLFAQIGTFKRHVHGFSRIPDPLCVYPK